MKFLQLAALAALVPLRSAAMAGAADPMQDVLAADTGFAAAAAGQEAADGIAAAFDDAVMLQQPGGIFAKGRDAAAAALRASTSLSGAKVSWRPAGGGVSADGQQAFSFGYASITRADAAPKPAKYLSYWKKSASGWRVAAYKLVPSEGAGPAEIAFHIVPRGEALPPGNHMKSLLDAERSFAAVAQRIGLGAAFRAYGSPAAINLGADAEVVVGNDAIAKLVGGPDESAPSPVDWGPDQGAMVADSGDLGVTFGTICVKDANPGACKRKVAFFTVWQRAAPDAPWRYVAE